MKTQDTLSVSKRFIDAVNARDRSAAQQVMTHDIVNRDLSEGVRRGFDEFWSNLSALFSAFPDLSFTIHRFIVQDDQVVYEWTARGTHKHEFKGVAPTGKTVSFDGIDVDRIEDGKIAEHTSAWDALGFLNQLGLVPEEMDAG